MPCRVRLVRCRRARCQGVIAEDRRLEPHSALREVPLRRVRPRRGRLPASHHTRQGVVRRVEVFEHLIHRGRGHGPVVVLLCGTQPGRQGGFILRGGDRRPQAVLDGRGLGVVREEAALRVAVGGGHRRAPRCAEEARQGQADREVVRADHLRVCHAASPDAFPQGPRQEGLVDQEGVHSVPGRVERGGHVLLAACRGPPETAGLPARSEVLRGRVGGGIHVDVGVAGDDHRVSPTEAACRGIHLYVGPERRPSRPRGAACLRPVDVDEGEASPVRADLQGRGLPGYDFRETEHLVLRHVFAADRGEEAPPSRGGGGSRLRQAAAEEGGVPLVPERRGHVHLLRPGGDPCFLEHDGKAPLLG